MDRPWVKNKLGDCVLGAIPEGENYPIETRLVAIYADLGYFIIGYRTESDGWRKPYARVDLKEGLHIVN